MEYNLMWNRNFRGMDANDQQQDSYMYMDSTLLRENTRQNGEKWNAQL